MIARVSCRWRIRDRTRMDPSSSLPQSLHPGLTATTSSLVRCSRACVGVVLHREGAGRDGGLRICHLWTTYLAKTFLESALKGLVLAACRRLAMAAPHPPTRTLPAVLPSQLSVPSYFSQYKLDVHGDRNLSSRGFLLPPVASRWPLPRVASLFHPGKQAPVLSGEETKRLSGSADINTTLQGGRGRSRRGRNWCAERRGRAMHQHWTPTPTP